MSMSPMHRVLTALGHNEPDRVPFFLLVTMHGARELGLSIKEYFSRPEHVVEGQLRMQSRYKHDCLYNFFYAPAEIEAWGGEVIFADDGPPNSGQPFIKNPEDIGNLQPPPVMERECLTRTLTATAGLKDRAGDSIPVIGMVMSPFSLPVMQMGFDKYIDLIYGQRSLFHQLMAVNEEFCVQWANAQLEAGATAITYFDPVSSPTIIPRDLYLKTGFEVAKRTIGRINGPTATHLASGRCLPIVDDLSRTGTAVVGASAHEDLADVKAACRGKLTILGNLNGVEMRNWTAGQAEAAVRDAIAKAGPEGGFILSDNHGEIPWQVPEEILTAISEAAHKWGAYPLESTEACAR